MIRPCIIEGMYDHVCEGKIEAAQAAIIEISRRGIPARIVADAVGIARGTVSAIVSREGWL